MLHLNNGGVAINTEVDKFKKFKKENKTLLIKILMKFSKFLEVILLKPVFDP